MEFHPAELVYTCELLTAGHRWSGRRITCRGHTLEELRQAWHDEAVAALGLVHGGQVPMVLYKTVFKHQVGTKVFHQVSRDKSILLLDRWEVVCWIKRVDS